MSSFISTQAVQEPAHILDIQHVDMTWGRFSLLPSTSEGKHQVQRICDRIEQQEKAKLLANTQELLVKQYTRMKDRMSKYAKKLPSNFFGQQSESSVSLEQPPKVDLQKKYSRILYPKLWAIKEAEDIVAARKNQEGASIQNKNIRRMTQALKEITRVPQVERLVRKSHSRGSCIQHVQTLSWKSEELKMSHQSYEGHQRHVSSVNQ